VRIPVLLSLLKKVVQCDQGQFHGIISKNIPTRSLKFELFCYDPPPDVVHLSGNNLFAVLQRHHGEPSHGVQPVSHGHEVQRAALLGERDEV